DGQGVHRRACRAGAVPNQMTKANMPIRSLLTGLFLLALASSAASAPAAQYKIVTASKTGTYIEIGRDLAKWVAEPVGIELEVLESKGSAENVQRMRFEPGVKLALVQSAVLQAFLEEEMAGNTEVGILIRPSRLVITIH